MSYYPSIVPFHAYRYTPFRDNSLGCVEFVCIKWINETDYSLMILKDTLPYLDDDADADADKYSDNWKYGDVTVRDWHVDLKEIPVNYTDITFAKLQGL